MSPGSGAYDVNVGNIDGNELAEEVDNGIMLDSGTRYFLV